MGYILPKQTSLNKMAFPFEMPQNQQA